MFLKILARSTSAVLANRKKIVALVGVWAAVMAVWFVISLSGGLADIGASQSGKLMILLTHIGLNSIVGAAIAVIWHRLFLLREEQKSGLFRFGAVEFEYLGRALLIGFGWGVAIGLSGILLYTAFGSNGLIATAGIILVSAPLNYRLSLVLPATAIGERFSFKDALRVSKGLGLPMALVNLVLLLPIFAVFTIGTFFQNLLVAIAGPGVKVVVGTMLEVGLTFATALVYVTVLSVGYNLAKERWFSAAANT
ncbi:MAG: hypothetical protein AAGA50_19830 [Pseudomonadota bacterium]